MEKQDEDSEAEETGRGHLDQPTSAPLHDPHVVGQKEILDETDVPLEKTDSNSGTTVFDWNLTRLLSLSSGSFATNDDDSKGKRDE